MSEPRTLLEGSAGTHSNGGNSGVSVPLSASTEAKVNEAVAGAIANATATAQEVAPDVWESASRPGLKFKLRKISKLVIHDVGRRIPDPEVPTVFIKDQDRWEENKQDPTYILAQNDANYRRGMAVMNVNLTLGAKMMEPYPADLGKPEDEDWSYVLTELGVGDIPPVGNPARYAVWLKMHVLDEDDLMSLNRAIQRYNGRVFETEVEAAQDELKSVEARPADTASTPTTQS